VGALRRAWGGGGRGRAPLYCFSNRGGDGGAGGPFLREAYDLLGRVYVHVYPAGVHFDAQGHRRIAARGERGPVGVVDAAGQILGPHPTIVHRDRLARPASLGNAGQGGVSGDLERAGLVLDRAHRAGLGDAVDLGEALEQIFGVG
jgi:hypothetical protein